MFLEVIYAPSPKGGGPAPRIFGTSINAHTVLPTATTFGRVRQMEDGRFFGSDTPPILMERGTSVPMISWDLYMRAHGMRNSNEILRISGRQNFTGRPRHLPWPNFFVT